MKNNKGFGLIEVMVTLSILSIVMLGMMQTMANALLVAQTADTKSNLAYLVTSTASAASSEVLCSAAVTAVSQQYGQDLQFNALKTGANLSNLGLNIISFKLDSPVLVGKTTGDVTVYHGSLVVTAKATKQVYGSQLFAPRSIASIYLRVTSNGQIIGCGPVEPVLVVDTPPPSTDDDEEFKRACSATGGTCSHGTCTYNSHRGDD